MNNNLYIAFAPLQGYTDCVYRKAHHECVGGVDEYYTPFVRIEKGEVRKKDLRDTDPERNAGVPTVPQVIAKDADEFAWLCDALQEQGWGRIDLNMGCPFPMQVKAGRGSGLLQHPDRIEEIANEMQRRPEVLFSVKMRLGQESTDEGFAILPIINDIPLVHVTLHPRLGRQQYKGMVDMEAFGRFMEGCKHPMVFNGDLSQDTLLSQMQTSDSSPNLGEQHADAVTLPAGLKGVMIGRGLLARPWVLLGRQDAGGSKEEILDRQHLAGIHYDVLKQMHAKVYQYAVSNLCGDSQVLSRLHAFWEYLDIDRKAKKAIMKATTLRRYNEAVAIAFRSLVSL